MCVCERERERERGKERDADLQPLEIVGPLDSHPLGVVRRERERVRVCERERYRPSAP